jgi:putative restriction endonuclease
MPIWTDAVTNAIRRHVARTGSPLFTRQALIAAEIGAIEAETRTTGLTPTQTLGRELQQLRDAGLVEFLERGTYRWLGEMPEPEPATASKGIFLLPPHPDPTDLPERGYGLQSRWLRTATRMVGQWIIYQVPRPGDGGEYVAAARVARIGADPDREDWFLAGIASGSYLEFGRPVPFQQDGTAVERGLLDADGRLDGDGPPDWFARSRTPTSTGSSSWGWSLKRKRCREPMRTKMRRRRRYSRKSEVPGRV